MKVGFVSLGCSKNLIDTEIAIGHFKNNGYEIAGEIRESYIDGVWNKETENDWLTEIQIPVVKIK